MDANWFQKKVLCRLGLHHGRWLFGVFSCSFCDHVNSVWKKNPLVAELKVNHSSHQQYIEVTLSDGSIEDLWSSIIGHCAKRFSDNEVKKIYHDCKKQIQSMHPSDVPLVYHDMMTELVKAMQERKIKTQNSEPNKRHHIIFARN
jgi:hypothetical protein